MRIYLIRHGHYLPAEMEIDKNDGLLTEKGRKQIEKLGLRFVKENVNFDGVYSSSKIRAIESAKRCCKVQGIERIIFSDDLVENMNFEGEEDVAKRMRDFIDGIKSEFHTGSFGIFSHCYAIKYLLNSFSPDSNRKILPHAGVFLLDYSKEIPEILDYDLDKHLENLESY